jgi:predicted phosphate transport protein (TIGR00153 family)
MNIDKFLKIFVPKDHSFFPLFEGGVKNLVKAAELLAGLMIIPDQAERENINKEIKDIEHIGDEITDKIYDQLNKSFITPFDREDIHELAENIDDVVDSINGISVRICLYKPKHLPLAYIDLSEMILKAAREIENAVVHLKNAGDNRKKIMAACAEVVKIEHNADERYFKGVHDLFEKEEDPKELLKNNKIIDILERCVDEEEDVADTIKAILIKNA